MSVRASFPIFLAILTAILLSPVLAFAQSAAGPWAETEQTRTRLIAAVTATGDLDFLPVAIEMELKPGWKTYWRSPGDAGFPPEIAIAGSANVASAILQFPPPHRFSLFGLETFGYGEHVVFPLALRVKEKSVPLALRLHLRFLVCADICIPYEHDLALDLPAGRAMPSAEAPLYNRFAALIPDDGTKIGWSLKAARIEAEAIELDLTSAAAPFLAPDLAIEGPPGLVFGKPETFLLDNGQRLRLHARILRDGEAPDPRTIPLTVTVFDGERAMERALPAGGLAGAVSLSSWSIVWVSILGFAFLGGLILNVMPCVLPVLALKLTGLIGRGDRETRSMRLSFLASFAGIAISFLVLAGILAALKAGGAAIGWGIQFQQPWFLALMAALCLAFAANVWGWFSIPLPGFAAAAVSGADRAASRSPHLGAFADGMLATLLATPCSAPFLGTAIGFALARGSAEIFLIFAAMAVGFGFPYLALAVSPGLVAFLPRPGPWLRWLKWALALSLVGTAIWLLTILAGTQGWIARSEKDAAHWEVFAPERITSALAEGRVVFVDVTADWCLTCRANEELVLDRDPVRARLADPNIVKLRADWTKPDDAIARYLADFGRYGIPFNVVYGPKAPEGIVLPELLTDRAVLAAIAEAGG